jgi:hypothetical protein
MQIKALEGFKIGFSMIMSMSGTILVGAGEDERGALMRGPKYLLYPAALGVFIWGINGVMTSQPDQPVHTDSVSPRPVMAEHVSPPVAPMTVIATNARLK